MKETDSIYSALQRLGIGRAQTRLYTELLKAGSSSVAELARLLNTSRQAIYLLLPDLMDRGLVKETKPVKRSLYQALPPSQLFTLIDDARAQLEHIVPLLTNIQSIPSDVPLVTVYDSPLSMRDWYRHFLIHAKSGDDFLLYSSGSLESWYKLDPDFYYNYMEQQVKRGINVRCLLPEGQKTVEHNDEVGWSVTEYRFTSQPLSPKVHQWIWQDQVCYQTVQGNATNMIVLQSKDLAAFAKKQFLEIWDTAKKAS